MKTYIESRLVGSKWEQNSEIQADSRRQAMKQLRKEDEKEKRTNVQRKVELAA